MKPEDLSDEELLSHRTVVSSVVRSEPDFSYYGTILSCGHEVGCVSRQPDGAFLGTPCFYCVSILCDRYGLAACGLDKYSVHVPFAMFVNLLHKARTGLLRIKAARTGSRRIKAVPKRAAGEK